MLEPACNPSDGETETGESWSSLTSLLGYWMSKNRSVRDHVSKDN